MFNVVWGEHLFHLRYKETQAISLRIGEQLEGQKSLKTIQVSDCFPTLREYTRLKDTVAVLRLAVDDGELVVSDAVITASTYGSRSVASRYIASAAVQETIDEMDKAGFAVIVTTLDFEEPFLAPAMARYFWLVVGFAKTDSVAGVFAEVEEFTLVEELACAR